MLAGRDDIREQLELHAGPLQLAGDACRGEGALGFAALAQLLAGGSQELSAAAQGSGPSLGVSQPRIGECRDGALDDRRDLADRRLGVVPELRTRARIDRGHGSFRNCHQASAP
jgi:hypothetical protein